MCSHHTSTHSLLCEPVRALLEAGCSLTCHIAMHLGTALHDTYTKDPCKFCLTKLVVWHLYHATASCFCHALQAAQRTAEEQRLPGPEKQHENHMWCAVTYLVCKENPQLITLLQYLGGLL